MIELLDEKNFDACIAGGVTLVYFCASWCQPCVKQTPILQEVAQLLSERITVGQVDVEDNPVLGERFGAQCIPTLIVFKDGKIVKRLTGVQPRQILLDTMEKIS